jgi:hypothetical protein
MTNNNHLYSDFEAKLDSLLPKADSAEKYDHWRTLQLAKAEYDNMRIAQGIKFELDGFAIWLEETYGFRIHRPDNMIGQTFEIIDEAKYTFYKLKYA